MWGQVNQNHLRPDRFLRFIRSNQFNRHRPCNNLPRFNQSRITRSIQNISWKRKWWGCQQKRYFLRDCPEEHRYTNLLQSIRYVVYSAVVILESVDKNPTDELDEISTYITNSQETDDKNDEEYDTWICDLLDVCDNIIQPQDSYVNKYFINYVNDSMKELNKFATFAVFQHILLDTGAPKIFCTNNSLNKTGWKPMKTAPLPTNFNHFRFEGQQANALCIACLACHVTDNSGKDYFFLQVDYFFHQLQFYS